MGVSRDFEPENGGTLRYRVGELEKELARQRDRLHDIVAEQAATRLLLQRVSDQVERLNEKVAEDVREIKHALYRFLFVIVAAMFGLAFTVFVFVGQG